VKSESEVAQSCPTLSHPTDCSLPGSSVHGISQARVLEWLAKGNLLYGSENSNGGSVSTERVGMGREMGWSFKREGIYVYLWLIHVEV